MRRTPLLMIVAASTTLLGLCTGTTRGDVPAPPVNQTIGMRDILFGSLTEADCRVCHSAAIPNRHHLLYGLPIPPGPPASIVPYPDSDGDGNDDPDYVCLSCHDENLTVVRDCTQCHTQSAHHSTPAAQSGDCVSCHGDIVDNYDDGHAIPTYDPTLVTPSPGDGDGLPLNSRGVGAGGCNYCHDDDGLPTPVIRNSGDLHHATGVNCSWCHTIHGSIPIRDCERCHGFESLHNIQADSPNPGSIGTIVVGGEDAGYGHVGREAGPGDSDCWGCHGFATAFAPGSGPIIPTIYSASPPVVNAGTETTVVVSGTGFTNIAGTVQYDSTVELTAADGSTRMLIPEMQVENMMSVVIPADVAPGNYDLRAVKDPFASNPTVLIVIPDVIITEATGDNVVTINGRGFGGYVPGTETRVVGSTVNDEEEASIVSWSDSQIVAEFGSRPIIVTVHSVHGSATAQVTEGGNDGDNWRVQVPLLSLEFEVLFKPVGSFLSAEMTYPDGSSSIGLGMEMTGVIFWLDVPGNIYFGNIDRDAGRMSGILFGGPAGSSMWTGEKL